MKRNWKLLNKLLGRKSNFSNNSFEVDGVSIDDEREICDHFNRFFINHPKEVHDSVPPYSNSYMDLLPSNVPDGIFEAWNEIEVEAAICALRKNGALEDIPRKFLLISNTFVSKFICQLFNLSLYQGYFPDSFKISKINPIFKKGRRDLLCNYRPISILINLSKIFETLIFNRLSSHFVTNEFLSENQFGFRKHKSTELAVCELVTRTLPAIRDKKFAICVFLDFTACFDTVCRDILLAKLDRYGVRGCFFKLLQSYFSNRNQFV